jgi:uncharacterized membrane protein
VTAPPRSDAAATTRLSVASRLLCLVMLGAGIAWRVDGLARKPLWYDEAATMLHLSGRRERDVRALYDGRPLHVRDLLGGRSHALPTVAATVRAVAADEPQIGPGYFVVTALWGRLFGVEPAAVRSLSAAASLLGLALLFVLGRDLGGVRDVGLAAAALAAVSPLHLRYAHEARPYALWIATLLGCALATRRAAVRGTLGAWLGCGVLLAAALMVQPLTILALPALAVAGDGCGDARRTVRRFGVATLGAGIAALAWALIGWRQRAIVASTTDWSRDPIGIAALVRGWLGVLTNVFYRPGGPGGLLDGVPLPGVVTTALWILLGTSAGALAVTAVRTVIRTPSAPRRFVPLLILVPWAAPALVDLALGGRRSTVDRYLAPAWIGLELAVAWWATAVPRRPMRQLVFALLLILGAATAFRTQPLDAWWDTDIARQHALDVMARRIAARDAPVVVTDLPPLELLELIARLDGDTTLRLGIAAPRALGADELPLLVVAAPSEALLAEAQGVMHPGDRLAVDGDMPLWHVAPE